AMGTTNRQICLRSDTLDVHSAALDSSRTSVAQKVHCHALCLSAGYTGRMTKPSKVDLVGVGLNATDTLITLARYPERGSKVEYTSATLLPGGQVATTVVACQLWGMSTRYVGILGDDAAAD